MKNEQRIKKKIDRDAQTKRKTVEGSGPWKNRDKAWCNRGKRRERKKVGQSTRYTEGQGEKVKLGDGAREEQKKRAARGTAGRGARRTE